MRTKEGEGLKEDLAALTRLMALSSQVAAHAEALYATEEVQRGMKLMGTADLIAEEVGVLAERYGYTIDEVTHPLWKETDPTTSRAT
jgi:hypothetical protein